MGQQWQTLNYYPGYTFSNAPGVLDDLSTFDFPDSSSHSHYPAFLVTTQATSLPANARLFFSCETGYDNNTPHPTNFWFYDPQWAEIRTNTGTVTLTAAMDPFTIAGNMLTVHGFSPSCEVQRSEDLEQWDHWTTTGPELPCAISPGFYRAKVL